MDHQPIQRPATGSRHQPAFLRGALVTFAVVAVVAVVLLDALSVYTAHRDLKKQTSSAASEAVATWVTTSNDAMAEQAAGAYLREHGVTMVDFGGSHVDGETYYEVTGTCHADTYVFHYLAHLPGIGGWIDRQLHPRVTGDSR